MSDNQPANNDYSQLLVDIKQRIRLAQYAALKAVNQELITLYWDIGQLIVDRQQAAGWGKSVVEQLADEYTFDFLELGDAHSERQLEQAILSRVEPYALYFFPNPAPPLLRFGWVVFASKSAANPPRS